MTQALAIAAFVRESERPLTGSITTFVRLARGDLECTAWDLHGPNLFQRTAEVLSFIHEQMALDPLISELVLATKEVEDVDELLITLLIHFALPFYWSVQSGNLPAFRFVCDRVRTVVDSLLEIERHKFLDHLQAPKSTQFEPPSASSLLIGLLTEIPVEVQDRRALWQAVVAQYRFKRPDWNGVTGANGGVHYGGPDPNGFPHDFELQPWCDELIFDELLQSVWLLHLATNQGSTSSKDIQEGIEDWFWVPGGVASYLQARNLPDVNFQESKDEPSTLFWMQQLKAFRSCLDRDHGIRGVKVLKKGETPEVDWQQFLRRY